MTHAHDYRITPKGYYYIDSTRVSQNRFNDSVSRSQRIANQNRRSDGSLSIGFRREIRRPEIVPPTAPPPPVPSKRWIIRGTARPKRDTNARTNKLVSDHFVEIDSRIGNIDVQEEMLNEKYKEWTHFDTYIEEMP